MIKRENFIDGEIYEHENGNIFKWNSNLKGSIYFIGNNKSDYTIPRGDVDFKNTDAVHIASDLDKQWLEACIIAGKTVPLKEIIEQNKFKNQTYEIY